MIEMNDEDKEKLRAWLNREPLFSQREIFKLGLRAGLTRARAAIADGVDDCSIANDPGSNAAFDAITALLGD